MLSLAARRCSIPLLPWILLTWTVTARAQGVPQAGPNAAYESRLESLESELARLKTQLGQGDCAGEARADCQLGDVCREHGGGLYTGYAFVFAKAHYKESFEADVISPFTGELTMLPFSFDYSPTPRVWLGYEGDSGAGIRATYWQFDHHASPLAIAPPPGSLAQAQVITVIFPASITAAVPGDVLEVENRLQLHTLDVEGTARLPVGPAYVVGSGGLRYARLTQSTNSAVQNAEGIVTQQLDWTRFFEGLGPTAAAEVHYPIGSSGIDMVGNVRGALLFGDKNMTRFVSPGGPTTPPFTTLEHASDVVAMGMLELGAEYSHQFGRGYSLLVRGMYEGQIWTDAGAPTLTFLGFDGFSVGVGLSH